MIGLRSVGLWSCCLLLFCLGCSNVAYHHSERISLTLEAKASDTAQPVQGNFGLKLRTIVTAPDRALESKKHEDISPSDRRKALVKIRDSKATKEEISNAAKKLIGGGATGDSASVISDFNLDHKAGGAFELGMTRIKSVFITGGAAVQAPVTTQRAIVGLKEATALSALRNTYLRNVYDLVAEIAKSEAGAKALQKRLDDLGKLIPEDVSKKTFYTYKDMANSDVETFSQQKDYSKNFKAALEYDIFLKDNLTIIENIINNRAITMAGSTITRQLIEEVEKNKTRIKTERNDFYTTIGSSQVIEEAINFIEKI